MLLLTYYARNYAGIIGASLTVERWQKIVRFKRLQLGCHLVFASDIVINILVRDAFVCS